MAAHGDEAQSRTALATALPLLSLLTHCCIAIFQLYASTFSRYHPGPLPQPSWFALYNTVALGASCAGLVGVIRRNPALLSAYTATHALTLLFCTLVLLDIVLPFSIRPIVPMLPNLRLDATRTCREFDNGFGWDESWVETCRFSFRLLELGILWVVLTWLGLQWFGLVKVWRWGRQLSSEKIQKSTTNRNADIEKGVYDPDGEKIKQNLKKLGLL